MSMFEDPIEILIEMARRGEIDPWNIDVVDVTDKFLKKLEAARSLDLRISGRVLLYAAILVRMKAETITWESVSEDEDFGESNLYYYDEDFIIEDPDISEIVADALRSHRRRIRKITTLKDLIEELRKAEEVERRRRRRKRSERVDIEVALKVPHEESLEEMIAKVELELNEILKQKNYTTLFSLIRGKDVAEIVDYYVSILHLAFRKKIELRQKEMYGDIEILPFGSSM